MLIRSLSAALFSLSLAACTHPLTPVETPPPSGTLYDYQIQSPNGVPYSLNELATHWVIMMWCWLVNGIPILHSLV